MGITVVTGPAHEPVTLLEMKEHLRVGIADDDGLIAGYILAARTWVEGQIHRPIVSQMFDFTADYCWPWKQNRHYAELPYPPLLAVRSVSYVDTNGATQLLAANQYTVVTNKSRGVVVPAYDATWPAVRSVISAITVRFIAGYTSFTDTLTSPNYTVTGAGIPDDLRLAVMTHVELLYDRDPQSKELLTAARDSLMSPYMVATF